MLELPTAEPMIAKLCALGINLPNESVRVGGYGDSPELSEQLLDLIRSGRKRAGTGLRWAYDAEHELIPVTGDIEIVVDHRSNPALVTRIVSVQVIPYGEVTAEYAAIEGEGDGSLAHWRAAHWSFFSRECQRLGRKPDESMLVVCSVFEVLHILDVEHYSDARVAEFDASEQEVANLFAARAPEGDST
jgi:uncharacterized protein YhfF